MAFKKTGEDYYFIIRIMKKKQVLLKRKLMLNKEAVMHLTDRQAGHVAGGDFTALCPSIYCSGTDTLCKLKKKTVTSSPCGPDPVFSIFPCHTFECVSQPSESGPLYV